MAADSKIPGTGRLVFDARELAKALRPLSAQTLPDIKQLGLVQLSVRDGLFHVAGSWFGMEVPTTGHWPESVQVKAAAFIPLFKKLPESGELTLILENGVLAIGGKSSIINTAASKTSSITSKTSAKSARRGKPAAVLVRKADFEKACALIKKHCSPTCKIPARVYLSGNQLEIEVAGLGGLMPFTGSWPGVATVAPSFILSLCNFPPRVDPVDIRVERGRIHVATSSAACTWEPAPPLLLPSDHP